MHDIGKIGVPDHVLNKVGRLTDEEYVQMKSHVTGGAVILKDFKLVDHVEEGTKYHHERYDGKGYPEGLKEDKIPLYARLKTALKPGGYFILTDYFALSDEEEYTRRQELIRLRKELDLPENEFYHYDTPLTVGHEQEALSAAGFSSVKILNQWGPTYTLKVQ